MLRFALEYREVIDDITADKSLKLRKYELDDEGWEIVKDLLRVLKVRFTRSFYVHSHHTDISLDL